MKASERFRVLAMAVSVVLAATPAARAGETGVAWSNASQAFGNSAAYSLQGSALFVSGAVGGVLRIPEAVGKVSGEVADDLLRMGADPSWAGLPVDAEVYTVGVPPDVAIEREPAPRWETRE